jgi:hypothetical protein
MNKLNIESITQGKASIEVKDTPAGISVIISGDIDMQDPSVLLDPVFEKVHTGCMEKGIKVVEADVRKLMFLNSSGIKAIAKWIMKLAGTSADKKYQIKILQNKEITWQATSLLTLTFLVPGSVVVE